MLSVAARGSSPEERKTVSTLHLRLLTPLRGLAKFFCWPHCRPAPSLLAPLALPSLARILASRKLQAFPSSPIWMEALPLSSHHVCVNLSPSNNELVLGLFGLPDSSRAAQKLFEVTDRALFSLTQGW